MSDKIVFDQDKVKEPTGYFIGTAKPGSKVTLGTTDYTVDQNGGLVRYTLKNSKKRMHRTEVAHNKASRDSLARKADDAFRANTDKMFKELEKKEDRANRNAKEVVHPKISRPVVKKIYTPEELKAKEVAKTVAKEKEAARRLAKTKAKKANRRKQAKLSRKANFKAK